MPLGKRHEGRRKNQMRLYTENDPKPFPAMCFPSLNAVLQL
jgi:hypothetical protein